MPNEPPAKITYTHELKITAVDRILLFPLNADNDSGSLYIGVRYIAGGLHHQGSISALYDSLRAETNYLSIQWPNSVDPYLENNKAI